MQWKEDVIVKKENNQYTLILGEKELQISPEHSYIMDAVQNGIEDDQQLIKYIQEKEGICEAAAGFTLAGFLIQYAEYVAEDHGHMEIL